MERVLQNQSDAKQTIEILKQ